MKIELISPCLGDPRNIGKAFHLPQIGLALIAGLTPDDMDVSITDELVQPIDFSKSVDLVGITVTSKTAMRAYEIADEFRRRGVPVVLGGIHPTVESEEASQHADAVVIGEAEDVWSHVLEDCRKGELKKFYRSGEFPNLDRFPNLRRDLFQRDKYATLNLIQTSRGCPFSCHFCSVSAIYGKKVRLRPADSVIKEIENLEGSGVFFVDDNITGIPEYSRRLFTSLIPLGKKWIGQASVTVANNQEDLKILHQSGCQGLFIGFETTSVDSLKEVGKSQNINRDYFDAIKKLHDNGISLVGSFVLGFDSEDKSCFERLLDFSIKSGIDAADFSILTPYPGTVLYKRMEEENRLIYDRWWLNFAACEVVHRPKRMTVDELYQGYLWITKEFYKIRPILKRCVSGITRRSLFGNILNWQVNMGYRRNSYANE